MGLWDRLEGSDANSVDTGTGAQAPVKIDKFADLKARVHDRVIESYNARYKSNQTDDLDVMDIIHENIRAEDQPLSNLEETKLAQEIYDDVMGLGPIEPFLRDNTISEIMVNHAKQIYVERKGRLTLTTATFKDDEHVLTVINRIVSPIGRRCDESSPMVDARLPDGSRVNAIIPPVALKGPSITIRKFSATPLKIEDLINFGSVSPKIASFLEACVKGRCNMVVSGGTGSGKTTLLNVLSAYIGRNERIVTIEDSAELQLEQPHVVTLESRPENTEGKGAITIRDLVKNALRMRPDRIVVGECRSGETLDMLQAMNTGHDGSLTTVHANSPRDVIARLETMVLMAGMNLPSKAIREQIVSAIDVIVQQQRLRDGSRKIISVSEILGMEGDVISMQEIFTYKSSKHTSNGHVEGKFESTGIHPHILDKITDNGVPIRDTWFVNEEE